MNINHICHFFHFGTLAGPLSSTFEMMFGKQGIIRTKRYLIRGSKETTACNVEKNRAQGLFLRIGNIKTISG